MHFQNTFLKNKYYKFKRRHNKVLNVIDTKNNDKRVDCITYEFSELLQTYKNIRDWVRKLLVRQLCKRRELTGQNNGICGCIKKSVS